MNPNAVQQPGMTPQGPQPYQMPGGGVGNSPINTLQTMQMQGMTPSQIAGPGNNGSTGGKKSPQMPSQPFSATTHHIYNTLRNSLMSLVQQGVPGIEKVLAVLNNEHVNGMKQQAQAAPTMPQQQPMQQQQQPQPQQPMMPLGGR
jgi:hypothetical protein